MKAALFAIYAAVNALSIVSYRISTSCEVQSYAFPFKQYVNQLFSKYNAMIRTVFVTRGEVRITVNY
jgi:hypothetical protein